jgi:3-deoxy-D-manno-octulosonate 8-phosphate phosphatase (KDO 8-P phosphatase)
MPAIFTASDLDERCAAIELLVLDVDGVMTDGSIQFDDHGAETKTFFVRDGTALVLWHKAGKQTAILSGRRAATVERRAAELRIAHVEQGLADKGPALVALLRGQRLSAHQVCAIGDDLADLPVLRLANLAACPGDAVPEVRAVAHLVTAAPGGRGTVREVVETILKAQGLWDDLVNTYT